MIRDTWYGKAPVSRYFNVLLKATIEASLQRIDNTNNIFNYFNGDELLNTNWSNPFFVDNINAAEN